VWQTAPGALEWLKREAGAVTGKPRARGRSARKS
jgi:hypothetical protein